ncbi:MAG: hypothetical protein EXS40_05985 [Opitutaceae bacterium]|nr:hypothetical protein [Opitutaceae bacterium]
MRSRPLFLVAALAVGQLSAAVANPRVLLLDGTVVGSDIVAVGERGAIFRSADNALTWHAAASLATATLTGVAFATDGTRGWAVGHDALILTTTDAGRTWQQQWQGENLADSFLDILALDARRAIAVGAYGLSVTTTDGGKTWTRRKISDDDYHLNRLSRGPTGTLYLAGEHGTLLRSADDGVTWKRIPAAYEGSFYGILPLDKRTLIAHGLRGRSFRSIDDGDTWVPLVTPEPVLLAASLQLRSNFFVLAGHARALLVSRDYGKSLQTWDTPLTTAVAELIAAPDGSIVALGEAGATRLEAPR